MRHLTFGAVVLASLVASGAAFAADEPSRNAADAAAYAAASSGQQHPLGYMAVSERAGAFADLREQAPRAVTGTDRLFLSQGDRGIGNE